MSRLSSLPVVGECADKPKGPGNFAFWIEPARGGIYGFDWGPVSEGSFAQLTTPAAPILVDSIADPAIRRVALFTRLPVAFEEARNLYVAALGVSSLRRWRRVILGTRRGEAEYTADRRRYPPRCLIDEGTLARTLFHERTHVWQHIAYGPGDVQATALPFEHATYQAEEEWWETVSEPCHDRARVGGVDGGHESHPRRSCLTARVSALRVDRARVALRRRRNSTARLRRCLVQRVSPRCVALTTYDTCKHSYGRYRIRSRHSRDSKVQAGDTVG